ncbi:PH domain-containing protein [Gracilibacillus phocaeensis]|nr:PH domain-containing protein [Gracilibacillus phocaeensis]
MSEPKRLHPAAVIFNIIQAIKQSVLGLLPLAIVIISNGALIYLVIGAVVLLALGILFSVLSWMRFTYRVEDDQLLIEKGILIRKNRTISKHRIQSIDLTQNIIHRIFGLTKVQIETAGNDPSTDAALSAVSMEDGKRVHDQLKYKKQEAEGSEDEADQASQEEVEKEQPVKDYPQQKITLKTLLVAGSTSAGFGIVLGIFGLAFSQVESLIPDHVYNDAANWVISLGMQLMIIFAVITIFVLWLLSILQTVLKYWNFTITRYDKELFITRGLLEKKQSTIPLNRIQAVGFKESIIHQPLGFVTVYVEIASGEATQNQEMYTVIFPLIRKSQITEFLAALLPEYHYSDEKMTRLPKKALPYYLFRSAIIPLIATVVVGIFFLKFIWIPAIFFVLACLLGVAIHRTCGYHIDNRQIMVQNRTIGKDTVLIQQRRIQAFQRKQHILHRKQALATIDMAVLNKISGRHVVVKEMNVENSNAIADWYSYRKE